MPLETPFLTPSPLADGEKAREVAMLLSEAASSWGCNIEHSLAVANLSRAVGVELSLGEEVLEVLALGALLHDVGKLGVPNAILRKSGPLTDRERTIVELHAGIGGRMIELILCLRRVAPVIRHHHERYDGSGYPDGLEAEEIPLPSRIVAAADAYDAMVSRRIYRSRSSPPTEALGDLTSKAGSLFDAGVVSALGRVAIS